MVVAFVAPGVAQAGDRLNAARGAAGASARSGTSSRGHHDGDHDDDDDDGVGVVGILLGAMLSGDDEDDGTLTFDVTGVNGPTLDRRRGFLPYPYADRREGYMVRAAADEPVPKDSRRVAFQVAAEGGYLYEDVWRASARARFMLSRFYGQFRYDFLLEGPTPRLDGDLEVSGTVRDRLHFTTFELGPQFSPGERLSVRLGLAGNLMFDDQRSLPQQPTTTPGIGAVLGVDLYPVRPLVFSGRGAVMRLGDALYLEARATVGVSLNRFELFAGYDHRQVGPVHLGGPTAGVAVRF